MPRFAILTHDHPFLHWDFLLESGAACKTWRLLKPPDTCGPIPAEPLADHRLIYLEYEGPVSGDRGCVQQWDAGDYSDLPAISDALRFRIQGRRLAGEVCIERQDAGWTWQLSPTNQTATG